VLTDDDWRAYRLLQDVEQAEYRQRLGRQITPTNDEYLRYVRAKSPPVSTSLAYEDGKPCAYMSSWEGVDGVGQIEDLFTHPDHRHRGLGTALIARCVLEARSRGAGPVLLEADPTDTPMHMYREMGFRPLFIARSQYR
jgi:ribosomal protein S18 acetylase RimI-like enzyme